jgi:hypothetical protein
MTVAMHQEGSRQPPPPHRRVRSRGRGCEAGHLESVVPGHTILGSGSLGGGVVSAGKCRRCGVRTLRVVIAAARASQDRLLNLHAMGFVYATLLSLVPLLALAFSVLKAFDAHYRLEPMLAHMLAPLGPQGAGLTERVVEFVSRINAGVLGAFGLAGLFYTALTLIEKIDALNQIWTVRAFEHDDTSFRRFRCRRAAVDYSII